jgi:hypothetical protein
MADQVPSSRATPDFGSLGANSDLQAGKPITPKAGSLRPVTAALVGVVGALCWVSVQGSMSHGALGHISKFVTEQGKRAAGKAGSISQHDFSRLDTMSPQHQAEYLLERAIHQDDTAIDKITQQADGWLGKIKLDARLNPLFITALDAPDLRIRAAAIEVDLAAQNVAKTPESANQLIQQVEMGDTKAQVWAVWTLGLLANRGVETERITEILVSKMQDPDPNLRHWAVEGLAYVGNDASIAPLLKSFREDSSPLVRERAGCSLAESGMLTREQRRSAIPALLDDAQDLSLGGDTRSWAYQALRDITGQNLPNEPTAWRNWYSSQGIS